MSNQTDTDVVIVGAGPTGLMLAGELAQAGVRTTVLDRNEQPVTIPKGNGVVGRSALELRSRGLLRGTGLRAVRARRFRFGPSTLELGWIGSPLHILPIPQRRLEALLEQRATRLGAKILRGREVAGFEPDDDGVTVHSGVALRTRYLVGCDGAHSLARKHLGFVFPGVTSTDISRLARLTNPHATRARGAVEVPGVGRLVPFLPNRTAHGSVTIAPVDALDGRASADLYLVSTHEPRGAAEPTDQLGDGELRASLRRVLGADLPFTTADAARSVVANSRQAQRYRVGRVFLAGDAAHIFSAGGSAINAGLLDAIALATSLRTGDLDSYETLRYAAGARTLALTRVQLALEGSDETGEALRAVFGALLSSRTTARRIATLIEG
jgi:2-polyprenyl-6-methoxyphenol hydroxylase-like FAD-dependent oxidoreductase